MRIDAEFLGDSPEELRPKLVEYAEQSRRGVLVLEKAVADLGATSTTSRRSPRPPPS